MYISTVFRASVPFVRETCFKDPAEERCCSNGLWDCADDADDAAAAAADDFGDNDEREQEEEEADNPTTILMIASTMTRMKLMTRFARMRTRRRTRRTRRRRRRMCRDQNQDDGKDNNNNDGWRPQRWGDDTWEGRNESQQLAFSCQVTPTYSKFTFSKLWQTPFNPANRRVSRTRHPGHRNNLGLPPPRSTLPSQPKKETIRCDMATTSSKTVQPPQTQTHAWQAHLNQSQNSCPRFNLPLRRNVNPPGPLSLGLGSRGLHSWLRRFWERILHRRGRLNRRCRVC